MLPRSGGGGDIVANIFVLGQRFDFAAVDRTDGVPRIGRRSGKTGHATVHRQ